MTDHLWVRRLRPRDASALRKAVSDEAALREARLLIGDGAVGWAVEVARLMATTSPARSAGPYPAPASSYAGPSSLRQPAVQAGVSVLSVIPDELTARSAEALALYFLTSLAGFAADDIPEIVGLSVREFTRRNLPADEAFHPLKGHLDCLVRELFRACHAMLDPSEAAALTRTLSEALVSRVQHTLLALAERAENERRGWFGSAAALRQELVLDILDGADISAPRAFLRLGYDISRSHIALIVWRDDWGGSGTEDLADAATALLRSAGCSSLLTVPVGLSTLWAWGSRARGRPLSLGELRSAAGPAQQMTLTPGMHIAGGLPGDGIEGFRTSHWQARETTEIIRAAGPDAGSRTPPYDYAELELAILLRSRRDLSAEFVRRALGPMAADDMSELRATVKCYLDMERSMSAVASRLHIAKSSVAYRIRKAERLLGHPVQEDRLRLHSALLLFDVLGGAALGRSGESRERPETGPSRDQARESSTRR
ncbi:helix-turn-helix domain-containing protein [Streptomyces sp. NPDC021749]|uniref:PucR family transcriptional regulator n=1 Tax=Streptomyces sp. NPDC021749 TaxID=3154905 RepID=UPI0033F27DEF